VPSGDSFKYPLLSIFVGTEDIIGVVSTPFESIRY